MPRLVPLEIAGMGAASVFFSLPQLSWKSLSLTGLLLERTELYLKGNFGANGKEASELS